MKSPNTLYVINPNSLATVTAAIDEAMQPIRAQVTVGIRCLTLEDGPPGIVSQADSDSAIAPLLRCAQSVEADAAAYVIACYSDPGIHALRELTTRPVVGIGEASVLLACTLGQRIGVIAVAERSIPRHLRYYAALGLSPRIAGERAANVSVAASGDREQSLRRLVDVGRALREQDGADVVILGCAGMSALRAAVEDAIGVPVVDPCKAGAGLAIARLLGQA